MNKIRKMVPKPKKIIEKKTKKILIMKKILKMKD